MKKYYAVEVSEYNCGEIVDKFYVVHTAHPEEIYEQFVGNTTLSFYVRKATREEKRAYKVANNINI